MSERVREPESHRARSAREPEALESQKCQREVERERVRERVR